MGMEDDVTLGGGHTMQCTDNVSWIHILETYIILLTNITPVNLIKNITRIKIKPSHKHTHKNH